MIRILHVVTKMGYGGLEAMIMNYYRHIDRRQVQFDFLVHRPEEADYHDEIRQLGGKIYYFGKLNPFSLSYRKKLRDFFSEHKEYKLIHVHLNCMSSVVLKQAKKSGVPQRIAHSHNSNQDHNVKYPIKLFYRSFIPKYATKLFACGKEAGDFMFGKNQYEILYNAIDAEEYRYSYERYLRVRKEHNIEKDELIIGHVGKFILQKNHAFILDIFSEIIKKKKAKLYLIGKGVLKEEVEEKAHQMGLDNYVVFTGVRPDVADLLQMMDLFLFPSLYEGLPVALVEAQAAGLPCLISDSIPSESIKTELVSAFSLNENAKRWAEKALQLVTVERRDTYNAIVECGYDICENSKRLQLFYLETYNKE